MVQEASWAVRLHFETLLLRAWGRRSPGSSEARRVEAALLFPLLVQNADFGNTNPGFTHTDAGMIGEPSYSTPLADIHSLVAAGRGHRHLPAAGSAA